MKNNILKYGLLTFMWFAFSLPAFAGPGDPPIDDDPEPAPIDNWILILVLAAVALGIYFIKKNNTKAVA